MEVKLLCQHCGNQGIHSVIETVTEIETIELEPGIRKITHYKNNQRSDST